MTALAHLDRAMACRGAYGHLRSHHAASLASSGAPPVVRFSQIIRCVCGACWQPSSANNDAAIAPEAKLPAFSAQGSR
jgi:hypothetical protein